MLERINPGPTVKDSSAEGDPDPTETAEWLDALESVLRVRGRRAGGIPAIRARPQGEGSRRRTRRAAVRSLSEHDPARKAGRISRRHRHGDPHYGDHSMECAGDGRARERRSRRARWARRELRLRRRDFRGRLQSFLPRSGRRRGWRCRLFPAALGPRRLRARLPRRPPHRGAARALSAGDRRPRPLILSPSLADAGLLADAHGVHGHRADQRRLPGPLHALLARSQPPGHGWPARLGRLRRRRDGRA